MKEINVQYFRVQLLDIILKYLSENSLIEKKYTKDILKYINDTYEITLTDIILWPFLQKLIKDGFIEQTEDSSVTGLTTKQYLYSITWEGSLTHELGGYKIIQDNKNSQIKQAKYIFWLTVVVSLGTAIAALYYILEIVKFFHSHCS